MSVPASKFKTEMTGGSIVQGQDTPKPNSKKKSANDNMKTMKTSGQVKARTIGPIWDTEGAYVILKPL